MSLTKYHEKYSERSDAEMAKRILAKKLFLKQIFEKLSFVPKREEVRAAILGCGEKRFVKAHKILLEELLEKPVQVLPLI